MKNKKTIEIGRIPINEMLMMMDSLRTDLASGKEIIESPEWHKKALQETEQRFAEEKERTFDWHTAKKELRKHFDSVTG